MFIIFPLILILASSVGIFVIVWKKMPYLKKLTPGTEIGSSFLDDLLPELKSDSYKLKFSEYKDLWLAEVEKFLRRLRVVSLRMDRISDSWIKKIRNGNAAKTALPVAEKKEEFPAAPAVKPETTMEDMRREEQRLIIEIAKTPKDAGLYETLGDLYARMKNFQDAKDSYEAAMELNPDNESLKIKHSQVVQSVLK